MADPKLEEVFKLSGVPTYTFIKPVEYDELIVSLRTPGRGLVIEGPSGIGKTTSAIKALEELNLSSSALRLSARVASDLEIISALPTMERIGVVIIDDFHRLPEDIKKSIADFMKTLADSESDNSKVVVVGINKAGDSLVKFAADLNNRIDTIRFEANPQDRVLELIDRGEQALNIAVNTRGDISHEAHGSFHLAQLLCHRTCLAAGVTERCEEASEVQVSIEVVKDKVLEDLKRAFFERARLFASGPRFRREGRGPYLHMLHWLATSDEWSIQLDQLMAQHPEHKASVGQVVDKAFLETFLQQNDDFADVLHYDPQTRVLSVEDPKFVYFLRNLLWSKFARQVGFVSIDFKSKYDFALSFAGADRDIAEQLCERLSEKELSVFYDKNEQHRILAENVEDYLGPIYRSEAEFVVALLGPEYPKRIWTKFESEQFRDRFGDHAVIPIWFAESSPGAFDETLRIGGIGFDRTGDIPAQIEAIADALAKKLIDERTQQQAGGGAGTPAEA